MRVREATAADTEQVVTLLRRSIIELCTVDHQNDEAVLTDWLANKSPDGFSTWLRNDDLIKLVATSASTIAGFGMASAKGEVMLNYVSPDFRFRGVSSVILENLESTLRSLGLNEATLSSTETAHSIYLARGWADCGPPQEEDGMRNFPMAKNLSDRSLKSRP